MDRILKKTLKKIKPLPLEIKKEQAIAEEIIGKIRSMEGKHIHTELVGSMARNTHLRGDRDLDIFVFFPEKLSREEFEKEGLRIGKLVFRGMQWEEAYSEHPYIRGNYKGFEVEIVPSYRIKSTAFLKSSVDRSVFHNEFLKKKLEKKQLDEVRLLRQFLKGIKCYGADLKTGSVPGYVAELLVLNYGNFKKTINAAAEWKQGQVISVEKHLTEQEARKRFHGAPLIIVDPTDATRNVAAALSLNQFSRFIAATRAFKKNPSISFFFGKKTKPWNTKKIANALKKKEIIAIAIAYPKTIPDIVWGQLKKLCHQISKELENNGFRVLSSSEWTDESKIMTIVFELDSLELSPAMKRIGPEISDLKSSMRFLAKHKKLVSGPRIENGRWIIETEREFPHAKDLLETFLQKIKRTSKPNIRKAAKKQAEVLTEKKLLKFYSNNKEFQLFLTKYLKGKEDFLV